MGRIGPMEPVAPFANSAGWTPTVWAVTDIARQQSLPFGTMALILLGVTTCPLCCRTLNEGELFVATTAGSLSELHPLADYDDAAMHRACFVGWEHREEFRRLFNERAREQSGKRGSGLQMAEDGSVAWRRRRRGTADHVDQG
jgi:hypothetical protein